ncbi:agamous-like MADS-box protein AGL6 [Cucurbita moschata]|uniref:Agamous-like MADS-box protein AGL6 n=1 Tax=Cucurbita moschata TaxID=3662 RepID=A0A6J1F370_CUCMO|nr:agamous-like MADS-box protein AGL6 [Cucurbita moschata]
MGRGTLSLKLISNPKSRRTTFQKRKKSLMKKAYELSTLCDVQTCVVIASEEFETWPSDRTQVEAMIRSYKSQSFCKQSAKSSYDLNQFFSDRKNKIVTETSKLREKVQKSKDTNSDHCLDSLSEHQLKALMATLDSKIGVADSMIEFMEADYDYLIEGAVEISSIDKQIFSPLETEASPELNISELGMEANYDYLIEGDTEILSVDTQTLSPFETELSTEFDVSEMFMESNYDPLIKGDAKIVSIDTQKTFSPFETEASPEFDVSEMLMEANNNHLIEGAAEIVSIDTQTFSPLETEASTEFDVSEMFMESNYDPLIEGAAEIVSIDTQTFSPFETDVSPEFDVSEMFMEANNDHLIEGAAEIVSIDTQTSHPLETESSPELNFSETFMEAIYDDMIEEPTEIPTLNSLETEVFSELDISELLAGSGEFEFNVEGFQSLLEDEDHQTLAENHSFIFQS